MKRPHYAWIICLTCALALSATMGLGVNVFTVYQPEILAVNQFTNAQISWITTTRSLFILASMLTVNQLSGRIGLRLVMALGVSLVGISCLLFSVADRFWFYCFAAALTGIGYCYGGMVPITVLVGHWFRTRRSLALGIAAAGSGVSTILAPSLITRVIERQGMCASFRWEGMIILFIAILVCLLLRDAPADLAMEPYSGGTRSTSAPTQATRPRPPALSRGQILALYFAVFLTGGPGGPGFAHLSLLYTTSGYDNAEAALFVSYLGAVLCVSKVLCGQVYDRVGGKRGNYYGFGTFILGLSLLCLAPLGGPLLPYLSVTMFGIGLPVTAMLPAVWAGDLYPPESYESTVRTINVIYTVGVFLVGPIPGILADWTGSYVPAYALFALCTLASMVIAQSIYRKQGVGRIPTGRS